jgi:predicted amidohydrolase YtcJ
MVVEDATVAWIGSSADRAALAGVDTTVQLDGALVTPAFVDAHAHVTETGLALTGVDVAGARSVAQILERVAAASRAGRGRPVFGFGWDELRLVEGRPPTATELDRAGAGGVVYLARVDGHSAVASSALLVAAGARALPGWEADGRVERDAHHAVRDATRSVLSPSQRRDVQETALRAAAATGIAAVHEMSAPHIAPREDLLGLLDLVDAAHGDLPHVVVYRGELARTPQEAAAIADAFGGRLAGLAGDLNVDGSVGSRTAAYRRPYADAPDTCGHLYLSAEQMRDHVLAASSVGLQAGFHVIGDAGAQAVLSGFAMAAEQDLDGVRGGRHRLEHIESLDAEGVATMARLGLTASVQPAFDALWGGPAGLYAQRLGPQRALTMNPFRSLAAAGVPLLLGSDSPVTPFDPWGAVRAGAFHWVPDQRLSAATAFAAHVGGALRPGAPATFALWEVGSPVRTRLPDLTPGQPLPECLRTVLRGRTIFQV